MLRYIKRLYPLFRENKNLLFYGNKAPLYAERLVVDPLLIKQSLRLGSQTYASGKIIKKKSRFTDPITVTEERIIKKCIQHWQYGLSWEKTGLIDELMNLILKHGSYDGCKSLEDVKRRYKRLDEIFYSVKKENKLKSRHEVTQNSFREEGGILIHLGPSNDLFFGGNGNHRLAMALILKLEKIPVQLGSVHINALEYLKELREVNTK